MGGRWSGQGAVGRTFADVAVLFKNVMPPYLLERSSTALGLYVDVPLKDGTKTDVEKEHTEGGENMGARQLRVHCRMTLSGSSKIKHFHLAAKAGKQEQPPPGETPQYSPMKMQTLPFFRIHLSTIWLVNFHVLRESISGGIKKKKIQSWLFPSHWSYQYLTLPFLLCLRAVPPSASSSYFVQPTESWVEIPTQPHTGCILVCLSLNKSPGT